jgi:hypothetical protein
VANHRYPRPPEVLRSVYNLPIRRYAYRERLLSAMQQPELDAQSFRIHEISVVTRDFANRIGA